MVRRCCCKENCNVVYFHNNANECKWINIKSLTTGEDDNSDSISRNLFGIDHRAKYLYENYSNNVLTAFLYRVDEKLKVPQPIAGPTVVRNATTATCVDGLNGQLYYATTGAVNTVNIRKRNFAGTDAQIFSETKVGHAGTDELVFSFFAYCRSADVVFYASAWSWLGGIGGAETIVTIRRISSAGTGDTAIYTLADTSYSISQIAVDNTHNRIMWSETKFVGSTVSTVFLKRCDFSGGNLETVLTITETSIGEPLRMRGLQFSHADNRIYFWLEDPFISSLADTIGGVYSCKYDGSDVKQILKRSSKSTVDGNFFAMQSNLRIFLGCGLETLGSSTKA